MSSPRTLDELEAAVRRDLDLIKYPEPEWVPKRSAGDDEPVLDVLIVGAGQGGCAIAAMLLRERVTNILAIDAAPHGQEGPWRTYARMQTLRTWKTVTGPDLGIPSLTFQAWYEAQHGARAFAALGKIAKEQWHDYLLWLRDVLALPVENGVTLERVAPDERSPLLRAFVRSARGAKTLLARKVVLAMGIERSGRWWMPEHVAALPERFRAHAAEPIDFAALRGKRVAVLGAGASAFDNAACALEAGARDVRLFCRRAELQRVQPYKAISYPGFLRHFHALDDATRWRFMRYLLGMREALPVETWNRVTRHAQFSLHTGSPWERLAVAGDEVRITTPAAQFAADFLIAGTGFDMDLSLRTELAGFTDRIATWGDRYVPPPGEDDARLARYPYLDAGFAFTEKAPGRAPFLRDLHCFDFGTMMSAGPSGSSINGMKFAVPRLVDAITRDLFFADIERHYAALLAYRTPEFGLEFARDRAAP
jgi:cation diffusion facilitator CzcD-associated flavoprotein CzcO